VKNRISVLLIGDLTVVVVNVPFLFSDTESTLGTSLSAGRSQHRSLAPHTTSVELPLPRVYSGGSRIKGTTLANVSGTDLIRVSAGDCLSISQVKDSIAISEDLFQVVRDHNQTGSGCFQIRGAVKKPPFEIQIANRQHFVNEKYLRA
jgi:hypothetical protein